MTRQMNVFEMQALLEKKDRQITYLHKERDMLSKRVTKLEKWNIGWQKHNWNSKYLLDL